MSRHFENLDAMATHFERLSLRAEALPETIAEKTAPVLYETTFRVFGSEQLADLAPSTQEERERLGFSPNDPLVRTGGLRDTVKTVVVPELTVGALLGVGSDDPLMEIHEHGTAHIPPRPALMIGAIETLPEAVLIAAEEARRVMHSP